MIETIVYKKTNFYRYAGSMKFVQDSIKDDPTRAVVHRHCYKDGRLWGAIPKTEILKWIAKNIGLYEVISDFPHKVFFDIDGKDNIPVCLTTVKNVIKKYFGNDVKMAISGSMNSDKKDGKDSFHICLYEFGINNVDESLELKALVKYIVEEHPYFDWKVYTQNRNMKAINQAKPKKPIQAILEDDDPSHHLITFFPETIRHALPKFSITIPEVQAIKHEEPKINYEKLPKMDLVLPENIDLTKANEILQIIPISKEFDHAWTWRVGLFCVSNGIPCETFISWYENKNTEKTVLDKWRFIHWKKLIKDKDFYPVSINKMLKILQPYYPLILEKPELRKLALLFNTDLHQKEIRYTDYLNQDDFTTDKKAIIVNIQMGGGKTAQTIDFLKQNQNFIWITPNIALSQNTHTRVKDAGIQCVNYKEGSSTEERRDAIGEAYNLIVCLNSLKYVQQNYSIVVIDEIETFLKLWFNNSTLSTDILNTCWTIFINLMKTAKKVILLDAFLSKITLDFLNDLKIDYVIIKKNKEENPRTINQCIDFKQTMTMIINKLRKNEKCLIFYPYKNYQSRNDLPAMKVLCQTLETLTGKKGIYHNADADDSINKQLENVNENWVNYDFVISNNKINVGLNFDVSHFDDVIVMIAGFNSPRDIVQFSFRARSLKNNMLHYCFIDKHNPTKDVVIVHVNEEDSIYQNLFKTTLIEKRAPIEDTFNFFLGLAKYKRCEQFCQLILGDEKLKFDFEDYYDYDGLAKLNANDAEKIVIKICRMEATLGDKLSLKKFWYMTGFAEQTPKEVMRTIWNNKHIAFMECCLDVLYKNTVIKKLKDNYGWELLMPDQINSNFKMEKEDIEAVFSQVNFKYLEKDKAKHALILKNYINTIYGADLISREKKNNLYKLDVDYREVYIDIVKHHKKPDAPVVEEETVIGSII